MGHDEVHSAMRKLCATSTDRLKDLADVQELIRTLKLGLELQSDLAPMVRHKYAEIWRGTNQTSDDDDD